MVVASSVEDDKSRMATTKAATAEDCASSFCSALARG